jgi:hypothetical protein
MSPESTSLVQPSSGMTKKRRKLFFSPKKCDFIDDRQYSCLQQTHVGKVVWSSSIIRLKEKNISSLRQGARCWLASGTHI